MHPSIAYFLYTLIILQICFFVNNKNKKQKNDLEKDIKRLKDEKREILYYGSVKKEGERPKKPKFASYQQFNEKLTKMRTRSWNDTTLKSINDDIKEAKKDLTKIKDKEKKIEKDIQNVFFSVSVKIEMMNQKQE